MWQIETTGKGENLWYHGWQLIKGWHVTTIVVTANNFFLAEPIDNWTSEE